MASSKEDAFPTSFILTLILKSGPGWGAHHAFPWDRDVEVILLPAVPVEAAIEPCPVDAAPFELVLHMLNSEPEVRLCWRRRTHLIESYCA